MAGVEGENEFRDADDGAETAPQPSSSRASSPSNAKPAAAAGGFGRRLLASIRLPSSFSATIGRSASPSGPKPLEPQPPVAPNLGLGLLLHQGPNPSADGSPTFDASAGNVHLHTMVDLQKRLEEGLGEQGTKADGEDQVIGHDVGVGDKLLVLVPMEEESQEKEDVADGCSGNRNVYSTKELDKEGEQHVSVELGAAMEDQEVMEQEGAIKCYTAVEDQSKNNDADKCTGDSPTAIKDDSAVEEKVEDQSDNLALEQHYSDEFNDDNVVEYKDKTVEQEGAIGIEGAAKDGIVVRLQNEDVLVEDQGEVQKVDVVEQCTSDVLEVAMGDGTVQDQELSVEQEGITEYFYAVVEDCSNKASIMQCTSDELSAVKNGNIVEKEEALDQEGEFGILGAAENIVTEGLQAKSNMVVEGEGEDIISIHYQQIVLEMCTSDEPGVSLGDSMVQDHEVTVLDQEGITECFAATVEDQSNISAFDELNTVKDGYFVEEKEKVMVEECAIDILGSAKNDDTVGSQEKGEVEVEVVSEQGEDVVSLQDQSRITTDVSAAHDQEVVEQDVAIFVRVGTVDAIAIDAQEKPVEQYGGDESRATKGTADEEKVVDQGDLADKQYAMKGNSAVESQENEGLAVKMEGEDRISIRDQDKVVEQCTSDQCGKTMDDNAADQEVRREKIRFCVGYPQRPGRPNCRAYMSTGSCSYGLSWYLNHPPQLKAMPEVPSFSSEQRNHETAQILQLNRVGLPIRENARNCTYYMRNATCRYGKRCCFNHPEHVLDVQIYKLTGWDDTNLPSSPHSKISSSPQLKKSSEDDCISSSSGILPPNLLQMLLPPQIVSPDSEAKETKAKKDPDWSSASDDSDGCCSANFSGGPLRKQELHLDYTERRDRQECTFLLKYGNCKFASSCQYYHPTDDSARKYHQKGPSLAKLMVYPDRPGEPECPFYMKTGACKFRAECKFHHPKDLTPSIQGPVIPKRLVDAKELHLETKTTLQDHMNQQQNYPERPDQPECRYYMQFGKCKFLSACKFHHPKNRVACMPECPFYMKTGTCQFGSECEFYHPKHRGSSKEGEIDDGTDYVHDCPERPGENECSNYMKHGYCRSQMNC